MRGRGRGEVGGGRRAGWSEASAIAVLALAFGLVGYGVVWVIEREGHAASVCGAAAVAAVEHEAAPRTLIVAWSGLRSGVVTGVLLPLDFGSASISYACQARWSPLGGWTGIVSRRVE